MHSTKGMALGGAWIYNAWIFCTSSTYPYLSGTRCESIFDTAQYFHATGLPYPFQQVLGSIALIQIVGVRSGIPRSTITGKRSHSESITLKDKEVYVV